MGEMVGIGLPIGDVRLHNREELGMDDIRFKH